MGDAASACAFDITQFLAPDGVLADLYARDYKQALKAMAALAADIANFSERDIHSALAERERGGCSGFGGGVCLPQVHIEGVARVHAVFARLSEPLHTGAADGVPVDLLCLLLMPAQSSPDHLKALALLSRILRDPARLAAIRNADGAEAIHRLLAQPLDHAR